VRQTVIDHMRQVAAVCGLVEDHGMRGVPHCLLFKDRTAEASLMRVTDSALLSKYSLITDALLDPIV
jgi:hypothetical protein